MIARLQLEDFIPHFPSTNLVHILIIITQTRNFIPMTSEGQECKVSEVFTSKQGTDQVLLLPNDRRKPEARSRSQRTVGRELDFH